MIQAIPHIVRAAVHAVQAAHAFKVKHDVAFAATRAAKVLYSNREVLLRQLASDAQHGDRSQR